MKNLKKKFISGTILVTMLTYTMPIFAFTNEETVYSKLDSNGEKYKTIVSSFLENDEVIQNEVQKDLPVDCKVKYELDGKEISAEELAGKNGKVKITLEYINKMENQVNIEGKSEILYTPFLVISGVIVDNENNKNIKVSNGKVINDGSKTIVMGIALPGMQESLNISTEDTEIPNKIEITMDSTNFEIGNIMSFCTPKILENGEIDDILDKTDELFEQVNDLQSATNQIEDGAVKLNNGVDTLNNGAQSLNNGANELNDGVGTLKSGTSKITAGANSLRSGTAEYTSKLKEFNEGVNGVVNGANTLSLSYNGINDGLAKLNENTSQLVTGANAVSAGLTNIKNILQGTPSTTQQTTISVTPNNADKITRIQNATKNNEDLLDTLNTNNETLRSLAATITDENAKASIEAQISANMGIIASLKGNDSELNAVAASLNEPVTYTANAPSSNADITTLISSIDQLIGVANNVAGGTVTAQGAITQLSVGSSEFKKGLDNLVGGANALLDANDKLVGVAGTIASGANELANGVVSLDQGANKLSDGTNSLRNGTSELANGTNTLLDGSNELVDGIKKFNNDGIKKINNYVNGDLKNTVKRIEKLEGLSADFNKFGSEEEREAIKFINILDSIKTSAKEEKKEEVILNSNEEDNKEE